MKLSSYALLLVLQTETTGSSAASDIGTLAGSWHQIEADSGSCSSCGLEIERDGEAVIVTANTGWAATLRDADAAAGGTGTGRWSPSVKGPFAGRVFEASFTLRNGRLHMIMVVDAGRRRQVVRAVYERRREWFGM